MATPQLSPGVLVREVDLTVGRADNVLDNIGAIAGPFKLGPVNDPIDITNEQELIKVFGKPISTDAQYEYWMSAASFLSYGGVLKVVRAGATTLANANAASDTSAGLGYTTALAGTSGIENYNDYITDHSTATNFLYAAKNPGTWANSLKVCSIDDFADQTLTINTTNLAGVGATIGIGVTMELTAVTIPETAGTVSFNGFLKGIVTGVTTDASNSDSKVDVKVVARVSRAGVASAVSYEEGTDYGQFTTSAVTFGDFTAGAAITTGSVVTPTAVEDWYDQQTLSLTNSTVFWKGIADKPGTGQFVSDRSGKSDEIHFAIVDDTGTISGIQGNILETHLSLSKAKDSISAVNSPQRNYYKEYLADFSEYIYAGGNPGETADGFKGTSPARPGFTTAGNFTEGDIADGVWGLDAQGVSFNVIGNVSYSLNGGVDYTAANAMSATLGNLITAYGKFENRNEVELDYIIMGPGCSTQAESQTKANYIISLAGQRKDCVAVVGPHRSDLIGVTNTTTQTNNLVKYFSPIASSSYAVFDSGYKYMFDRFNNQFRYVPTNADIAGLMTRTNIVAFPWFSPAGQQRGVLNNAIKLAYNPNKDQRDKLYPNRINPVITQPGVGTLLFGDKTALGFASAFDRINVRRLFLTIEQSLERAAEAQLFELNDELTRANFRNIVEPFLRDVQAKRGLYGFLVVCDSTNNTPDVIDNNEFRADIFLKPAKSINYVTLTFVATRTGVSFEEVVGRV